MHRTNYHLRNAAHLDTIPARTVSYFNSFLPSAVRAWNSLPQALHEIDDSFLFKIQIKKDTPISNLVFEYGSRRESLIHAQMRMGCSALASDLYNLHVKENPECLCGNPCENVQHYFFHCSRFDVQRNAFLGKLNNDQVDYCSNVLLYVN